MREYGSDHSAVILPDGYFEKFEKYGRCTWLRSGREALHLVALNLNYRRDYPTILMPAYCCYSMVDPFEKAGWKVIYYCLKRDLTVDLNNLAHLMEINKPKAVLMMDFFGVASTTDTIGYIKREYPKCVCIEDFSHCTFALTEIYNPMVDYYVTSIRKSVGVCDGAVIISKNILDESYVHNGDIDFVHSRYNYQKMKGDYIYSQDMEKKGVFYNELRKLENVLDGFSEVHNISSLGMMMLKTLNGEVIRYARQTNMKHLHHLLKGKVESVPRIELCFNKAPFSYPILVKNRDWVQGQFAKRGVYAPVLWPISIEGRKTCPISAQMSDQMLSLPIDQRYNYEDIEQIAQIVLNVCIK